jgi:hypothetical protein
MLRPLLALVILLLLPAAAAWGQQQAPPPPDTKPARERHRIQEKEPPPPEGPWGGEEFGFTWRNPVWRGLFFDAGSYSGSSIELNVPHGLQTFSDGVNPPIFERLEWKDERFQATSYSISADLDMIRLSTSVFSGTFDARGVVSLDNGVTRSENEVELHGDAYGFRMGIHWPALRYRDDLFELSAGVMGTVGWLHEEVQKIPSATLLTRDGFDVLTGSFGPKLSARVFLGRVALEAEAEYSFLTGAARGWTKSLTVGIGIHF